MDTKRIVIEKNKLCDELAEALKASPPQFIAQIAEDIIARKKGVQLEAIRPIHNGEEFEINIRS